MENYQVVAKGEEEGSLELVTKFLLWWEQEGRIGSLELAGAS